MKPLYIFDLDGTLALIEHRKHFLDAKDWRSFYAACDQDSPNSPVIATAAWLAQGGADVWIFSGRSDEVRDKTLAWIEQHVGHFQPEHLVMRREGDYRADDVLKQEFLDNMLAVDLARLVAVFDDRDRVVAMWRRNGIACFQVAPGDF